MRAPDWQEAHNQMHARRRHRQQEQQSTTVQEEDPEGHRLLQWEVKRLPAKAAVHPVPWWLRLDGPVHREVCTSA